MPGLAGVADERTEPQALRRLGERMCGVIAHRGDEGITVSASPPAALGRVSRGPGDPEPQPVFSRDRSLCLVMDGEIYNRRDLESRFGGGTDAEVPSRGDAAFLLGLFEARGTEFVRHVNGSFCFAAWDGRRRRLTLVNDRHGLRLLYYSHRGSRFSFCSEVKGLLQDPELRRRVDERSVADFLTFQMVTGERTLFEGVSLLPNASVLTWAEGRVRVEPYWEVDFQEGGRKLTEAQYAEEVARLFRRSVERRAADDLTKGVFLSGGLDSRVVLDALSETTSPLHSFTQGLPDTHDVRFAEQLARVKGSVHHYEELSPESLSANAERGVWLSDGMWSCEHMTVLSLLDTAREHCEVVFDGLGGDSLLGGLYVPKERVDGFDDLVESACRRLSMAFPENAWRHVLADGFFQRVKGAALESVRETARRAPASEIAHQNDYVFLKTRQRRFIFYGPVAARTQLECRTPYYDNDLVDLAYTIPASVRRGKRLHLALQRKWFPDVATVPWAYSGLPVVSSTPRRVLARRIYYRGQRELRDMVGRLSGGRLVVPYKREFKDPALWLRTTCSDWARGLILESPLMERGYFDRDAVSQLVEEHMSGRRNHAHRLCTLITLELFHRLFVD